MRQILDTIELGTIDGIDLTFNALIEDLPLDAIFDSSVDDLQELADKINNCDLVYFCAQVVASKNGIELASDYLGGCCYESYEQFVNSKDYIEDMKQTTLKEAKATILELSYDFA